MTPFASIIAKIDALAPKHFQKLIGIDGLGASGKTTLAQELQKLRSDISVIHVDEFYRPASERTSGLIEGAVVSPDFDWDRFEGQVIDPILRGFSVKYERFDWRRDVMHEWVDVPQGNWIIIVGIYALQSRFFSYYDYTIWCELSREERIKRMTEREGDAVARQWQEKWLPREERYYEMDHPDKRASLIL